jgi:hypothetical protein
MPISFLSDRHHQLFEAVVGGVTGLGYNDRLCQRNYRFTDWFDESSRPLTAPAAAFARQPEDYQSAGIAIFLPGEDTTPLRFRSLGAPFAIEVREDSIIPWSIGRDATTTRPQSQPIPSGGLGRFFDSVEDKWNPAGVLRAKNIGHSVSPRALDWVDLGLMSALESEISTKLGALLTSALAAGQREYLNQNQAPPSPEELYRLVFRLLSGKVFHDRKVRGFAQLNATADPREVLRAVCAYYQEPANHLANPAAQQAVAEAIWTGLGFQNLSVDALAFVYENTLVDDKLRKDNGIHNTPYRIARHLVNHLPFENFPESERIVVEPCSGHGVFLVAALHRMRDLLDPAWDARKRHRYFTERLWGFEKDAFALEVSKLCLTLADFPNPNGWNLERTDVFTSRKLSQKLSEARITLCNPPFEEFTRDERGRYGPQVGTSKPLEVLRRVLQHAHPQGCIGFVLPRTFVDGQSYREARGLIARRFAEIELVTLPDKVFRHADAETVLLLAKRPGGGDITKVHFQEVTKTGLDAFTTRGDVARDDTSDFNATEAAAEGFHIPPLQEVWDHLRDLPTLGSIAEIHRGVEWKAPFDERRYVSQFKRPGWLKGLRNVQVGFESYSLPTPVWLNPEAETRRRNSWDLDWSKPKVIANAATKARGAWRLAAHPDATGLVCTQSYHCLWPTAGWTTQALAALLNSPVVSAFVASREGKRHVRKQTLAACPVPRLKPAAMAQLDGLVSTYLSVMRDAPENRLELWGGDGWEDSARRILLQMDALILDAYDLPPWLERRLLDFFKGEERPVPFKFGDYFPAGFTANLPLSSLISPAFQASRGGNLASRLPVMRDAALTEALTEVS